MSTVPTPYELGHKVQQIGSPDSYGNRTVTYAEPVEVPVHWASPGGMEDLDDANREASKIIWTICTPSPCSVTERDRAVWNGEEYQVAGRPKDWTNGPWNNPAAAVLIELELIKG